MKKDMYYRYKKFFKKSKTFYFQICYNKNTQSILWECFGLKYTKKGFGTLQKREVNTVSRSDVYRENIVE